MRTSNLTSLDRRSALGALGAGASLVVLTACGSSPAEAKSFPVSLSEAEWRKKLTKEEFRILRQAGTERPYTSPLNDEKRAGTFVCAGCGNRLYSSKTKYDSRTGWPSFWNPLPNRIGYARDTSLGMTRTEEHCNRCGGHLGHVFDDGPRPTGKRHCINGLSLRFRPA